MRKLLLTLCVSVAAVAAAPTHAASQSTLRILIDHIGYDARGAKKLVVQTTGLPVPPRFELLDERGKIVFQGTLSKAEAVDAWHAGSFARGDFSAYQEPGHYWARLETAGKTVVSEPIQIMGNALIQPAVSDLLAFLKTQRASGEFDAFDRSVPVFGEPQRHVDAHGGWYDASGDVSKYLSHLSYANFMNPQQTPMVVWSLLASESLLRKSKEPYFSGLVKRMTEEALYGADFLVRMQHESGYFYLTVFDGWSEAPSKREICAYKTQEGVRNGDYRAAFREGGGVAIAALARASTLKLHGEYPSARYLAAAKLGFAHLTQNNLQYDDDHQENIIDDYTALLAASELYAATKSGSYLDSARKRSAALIARLHRDTRYGGFWRADATGERPFFHAVDAGLPVIALLRYAALETDSPLRQRALEAIHESLTFELQLTHEVANPFGYGRQYVKALNGPKHSAFFIPHENESGYWWQGENARLASLAAAALAAAQVLPTGKPELTTYAVDQLDWIFGLNPFDVCFLHGRGRNNAEYVPETPNLPGGICNGVTAGYTEEHGIAFLPEPFAHDPEQNWRWSEQWLPHVAWAILALSEQHATLNP